MGTVPHRPDTGGSFSGSTQNYAGAYTTSPEAESSAYFVPPLKPEPQVEEAEEPLIITSPEQVKERLRLIKELRKNGKGVGRPLEVLEQLYLRAQNQILRDAARRENIQAGIVFLAAEERFSITPEAGGYIVDVAEEVADPYASQAIRIEQALQPVEWPDDLISRVLPAGDVVTIAGDPGSMKSFIALDMAVHVAMGRKWLPGPGGNPGWATSKTPVLIVDLDCGRKRLFSRLQAILAGLEIDIAEIGGDDLPIEILSWPTPRVDIRHRLQAIQTRIRRMGAGLVVYDTARKTSGTENENDTGEMDEAMTNWNNLAETTGATQLLIHHLGKAAASVKKYTLHALRGSGTIGGGVDVAWILHREEGTNNIVRARPVKSQDAPLDPFAIQADIQSLDGTRIPRRARFTFKPIMDARAERLDGILDAVEGLLQEAGEPLNTTSIRDALPVKPADLTDALEVGLERERLTMAKGKGRAKFYGLPGWEE